MKYFYTKGWFRAHKKALTIYSQEEAESFHQQKKLYTVLVDSIETPSVFIEINLSQNNYVGVFFLDPLLQIKMEYFFAASKKKSDELFLNRTRKIWFNPLENKITKTEIFYFNEETGHETITESSTDNTNKEFQSQDPIDLSRNYEKIPEFGNYESIIREER